MINDELISRKAVIDRLQKAQNVFLKQSPLEACGISYAREIIASEVEIPTIENRPEGEWIDYSEEGFVDCPFCHNATTCEDNIDELHFCWNCGARLKGGAE